MIRIPQHHEAHEISDGAIRRRPFHRRIILIKLGAGKIAIAIGIGFVTTTTSLAAGGGDWAAVTIATSLFVIAGEARAVPFWPVAVVVVAITS